LGNNQGNFQLHRFTGKENTAKSFRGATFLTHTVQRQSAMQGSNDTAHTLSRRTAATIRFSTEGIGCQKQTAPSFANNPAIGDW